MSGMEDGPTLFELAVSRRHHARRASTAAPPAQALVNEEQRQAPGNAGLRHFHRENKNRPTEVSSKRPVGRHKDVVQASSRSVQAVLQCLTLLCPW